MKELTIKPEQVYSGELILVNYKYPYKMKVNKNRFSLIKKENLEILLYKHAKMKLDALINELNAEGKIVPVSGFRDLQEQIDIFEDCLRDEGVGYTTNFVALPGHSEHHTGLAIDLGENISDIDFICPSFPYDGICQEFRKNAGKFGFIERYKEGREDITKVSKEPWHFRYVGYPHSKIIEDMNITLEEYIEYLKQYREFSNHLHFNDKINQYEIYYIPTYNGDNIKIMLPEEKHCQISGNNVDGIIVTLW